MIHVDRKRFRTTLAFVALGVAGLVWAALYFGGTGDASGGSAPASAPSNTFDIAGKLSVASGCGRGGYSDLRSGAEVELVNQKNEVLAVTTLDPAGGYCEFEFTLRGVPRGERLYGVHIGNNNRGTIWRTEEEAGRGGFELEIGH